MALPALFAACTADDIVGENNGLQQDQRAKLSKDFVLKINNEVESRYAVEGSTDLKFKFEEGDKIGANLIDIYADRTDDDLLFDKKDPATWEIINTVSPALPFINEGGAWKSANEELGIGNYLFTNPFNPADKNRAAAGYELPVVVHYSSENPTAHIEAYNKAVAAQILREGETEAIADLKNIFAYPNIRINFDKNLDVKKVTKVVLAKCYTTTVTNAITGKEETVVVDSDPFIYKGAFNHKDIADMFNPKNIEKWLEDNKAYKVTEADYWAQFQTSHFIIDKADYAERLEVEDVIEDTKDYADIKTTPYFIYEMDETVVANSIDVRFMIPSIESLEETDIMSKTSDERITMYVCTDKGNFEMELTDLNNYQFSNTTLAALKNAAMQRNTSYTLKTKASALVDSPNASIFFNNVVSTAADWNKLVEEYGDLKKYSAEYNKVVNGNKVNKDAQEMIVNIISDEFALTSDLKMPEVAEFIIKSNVNVEGEVALKNIKIDGGKLIVKDGAVLTTDPTLNAPSVEIEKGGELVFAAEYNEDEELVAYTKVKTVNNHGTVTVPAGVEATFALNNACKNAVLNVGAAASRAAEVADAVANLSGSNYGIINNYSVINASGLTNNAPVEKNGEEETGYEWDTEELVWNAAPAINNFGKFNAKGSVNNYGLFVNENVLTSNFVGAAEFINGTAENQKNEYQGTLEIKAGAETYIDSNEDGKIILAELNPAKGLTIYKARKNAHFNPAADEFKYRGEIRHTLAGKTTEALDLSNSPVNYLIANADVEIAKTYTWTDSSQSPAKTYTYALETLEVTDGIVTLAARTGAGTTGSPYAYPAQIANLIVNGEVQIDGDMYSPMIEKLEVNAGGVFGIPADAMLQILLADITISPADEDAELEEGKVSVVGILALEDKLPQGTTGTIWPVTGGSDSEKYDRGDFNGKNIEINKDAEVKCVTGDDPVNNRPKEYTYYTSNLNLYQISESDWYKNQPSGATYTVKINSVLSMNTATNIVSGVQKYNSNYTAVLTGAKKVELSGSITKLTDAMALSISDLEVTGDAVIEGSENLSILTTDKLTIKSGRKLTIEGGWLIIDVTPALGQGCSAITIENGACVEGVIAAKNTTTGEYLFWNASTNKWVKGDESGNAYENSTVTIIGGTDAQASLIAAFNNPNVQEIQLIEKVTLSENAVINGNGKPVVYTGEDLLDQGVIEVTNGATIKNIVFNAPNAQYDVKVIRGNVVLNDCYFVVKSGIEGYTKRGIYSVGEEDVTLTVNNCIFNDEGYAFNSSNSKLNATFTNCELNGWMSGEGTYTFTGCTFGASGDYADFIPYGNATFNGCTFEKGFEISLANSEGKTLAFDSNTRYDGNVVTALSGLGWSYDGDGTLTVGDVTTLKLGDATMKFTVASGDTKDMELTTDLFKARISAN